MQGEELRFDCGPGELDLIKKIVERFGKQSSINYSVIDMVMDLDACHSNGCPLDFQKLLEAPDFDFIHDVLGIRRHINHRTGEIENCFLPRCAKQGD